MPEDTEHPLFVNVREAARILGVSPRTIWRFIQSGELETVPLLQKRRLIRYASVATLAGLTPATALPSPHPIPHRNPPTPA